MFLHLPAPPPSLSSALSEWLPQAGSQELFLSPATDVSSICSHLSVPVLSCHCTPQLDDSTLPLAPWPPGLLLASQVCAPYLPGSRVCSVFLAFSGWPCSQHSIQPQVLYAASPVPPPFTPHPPKLNPPWPSVFTVPTHTMCFHASLLPLLWPSA